jgi:non-heme chloroperoxidase
LTDFTEDLKKFDVPTLIVHGEDDQIVPAPISAMKAAGIEGREGHHLPGRAARHHGKHQDEINSELLRFVES